MNDNALWIFGCAAALHLRGTIDSNNAPHRVCLLWALRAHTARVLVKEGCTPLARLLITLYPCAHIKKLIYLFENTSKAHCVLVYHHPSLLSLFCIILPLLERHAFYNIWAKMWSMCQSTSFVYHSIAVLTWQLQTIVYLMKLEIIYNPIVIHKNGINRWSIVLFKNIKFTLISTLAK